MSKRFRFAYEADGIDEYGDAIPDIPVIYLLLESEKGRAWGPAVVDTGFDGGIYPNAKVVRILRGLKPVTFKHLLHPLTGRVKVEVYRVKASLVTTDLAIREPLGTVNIYAPLEPEELSDEVLIGRELLNKLKILLNGHWVKISPV